MESFKYCQLFTGLCVLWFIIDSCSRGPSEVTSQSIPELFAVHCTACHGADLQGDIAQSLLDGSWQFGSRRNDLFRSIKFGLPHHGMPSWGMVLSDDQINTLVDYLRDEEERLGVIETSIPETMETQDYRVVVEVIAEGLEVPWSMDWLTESKALITERSGRLRIWENGQLSPDSVANTPKVRVGGQGGLLDVTVGPDYDMSGWIYLAYSHGVEGGDEEERAPAMTSIVRGKLQGAQWVDQEVLFEAEHDTYKTAGQHFGGRIVFDPDGYMYFSIGDRGSMDNAQDLSLPNGKIHRLHPDGSVPDDNPFVDRSDALPSIYSYGQRNPQGLAVHPVTGRVWETEHGPLGGDELNLIEPGQNYGWPVISYGINYNGEIITDETHQEGMLQPIMYWKPSIAVCGLHFYSGSLFPKWNNRLLVGALRFEEVQLLEIVDDRVIYSQTILKNAGRVRDITVGPDGAIYIVLNRPGSILRLSPSLTI